jgi:hypothetical protein
MQIKRLIVSLLLLLASGMTIIQAAPTVQGGSLNILPACILPDQPQIILVQASGFTPRYAYPLLIIDLQGDLHFLQVLHADDFGNVNDTVILPPLAPGFYQVQLGDLTGSLVVGGCPISTLTTLVTTTSTVTSTTNSTVTKLFTLNLTRTQTFTQNITSIIIVNQTVTRTITVNETTTRTISNSTV